MPAKKQLPELQGIAPDPKDTPEQADLKEQLNKALELIKAQNQRQEQLESELIRERTEKDAVLAQRKTEGAGWLITTVNPMYDMVTYGLKFTNGTAWVSEKGEYEYGKVDDQNKDEKKVLRHIISRGARAPEGPAGDADRYDAQEAQATLAQLEKREKRSQADVLVELLTKDMGYKATYYDGSNPEAINQVLDLREQQAREAAEVMRKAREQGELLTGARR